MKKIFHFASCVANVDDIVSWYSWAILLLLFLHRDFHILFLNILNNLIWTLACFCNYDLNWLISIRNLENISEGKSQSRKRHDFGVMWIADDFFSLPFEWYGLFKRTKSKWFSHSFRSKWHIFPSESQIPNFKRHLYVKLIAFGRRIKSENLCVIK